MYGDTALKNIKRLNKQNFSALEEFDMGTALSLYVHFSYCNEGNGIKLSRAIRGFLSFLLYDHFSYDRNFTQSGRILGYSGNHGAHHKESFYKVIKIGCPIDDIYEENDEKRFDIKRTIKLMCHAIQWFRCIRKSGVKTKVALWLMNRVISIYDFKAKILDKLDLSMYKLVFVFYDLDPCSNVLVQKAKKIGIHTATMQHGAGFYAGNIHAGSISEIGVEFRASISDDMLLFNDFARNEGIKCGLPIEKLRILGIPKFIGRTSPEGYCFDRRKGVFGIVLNINSWGHQINIDMIKIGKNIANKYGYKYILRYHPTGKGNEYDPYTDRNYIEQRQFTKSVDEFVDEIDFAISCGSSVYVECIYLHLPVFRYVSSSDDKFNVNTYNVIKDAKDFEYYMNQKDEVVNNCKLLYDYYCTVNDAKKAYIDYFEDILRK